MARYGEYYILKIQNLINFILFLKLKLKLFCQFQALGNNKQRPVKKRRYGLTLSAFQYVYQFQMHAVAMVNFWHTLCLIIQHTSQ